MGTIHYTITQDMLVGLWGVSITAEMRCCHHQMAELVSQEQNPGFEKRPEPLLGQRAQRLVTVMSSKLHQIKEP